MLVHVCYFIKIEMYLAAEIIIIYQDVCYFVKIEMYLAAEIIIIYQDFFFKKVKNAIEIVLFRINWWWLWWVGWGCNSIKMGRRGMLVHVCYFIKIEMYLAAEIIIIYQDFFQNIVATFRGMHVSPAKHSYAWLPRKCDYRTHRCTDRQTDRQTPDKVIPKCRYALQATQKVKYFLRQLQSFYCLCSVQII